MRLQSTYSLGNLLMHLLPARCRLLPVLRERERKRVTHRETHRETEIDVESNRDVEIETVKEDNVEKNKEGEEKEGEEEGEGESVGMLCVGDEAWMEMYAAAMSLLEVSTYYIILCVFIVYVYYPRFLCMVVRIHFVFFLSRLFIYFFAYFCGCLLFVYFLKNVQDSDKILASATRCLGLLAVGMCCSVPSHAHLLAGMFTYTLTHICTYIYVRKYTYISARIYFTYTDISPCATLIINTYLYIFILIYIVSYMHTHIQTHIHSYLLMSSFFSLSSC